MTDEIGSKEFVDSTQEQQPLRLQDLTASQLGETNTDLTASQLGETNTDTDDDPKATIPYTLNSMFLYQNNLTGQVSSTHMSMRQLCKILCPVSNTNTNTSSSSPNISQSMLPITPHLRHLTPETNLLLQDPNGGYNGSAWKRAKDVPILRDAVILWYYCCRPADPTTTSSTAPSAVCDAESATPLSSSAADAAAPVASTAVTCRTLAAHLQELNNDDTGILFSSALTNSAWSTLDKLPHLRLALEAFHEAPISNFNQHDIPDVSEKDVDSELAAFLSATDRPGVDLDENENEDREESYQSDGGTRYVKDLSTGNWIHEALAIHLSGSNRRTTEKKLTSHTHTASGDDTKTSQKRKQKKPQFSAKKGRCWVYVCGLPTDCTENEVGDLFSKAGLLDLDPETQRPKIKLYRYKESNLNGASVALLGQLKGDASICFARPESVELAVTLLDKTTLRLAAGGINDNPIMTVQSAKFEQRGEDFDGSRGRISNAKRKVAKLATMQAVDWDEGEFNGRLTGGRKGLHIVVLKNLFDHTKLALLSDAEQEQELENIDQDLQRECGKWGSVEKTTFFSQNPEGIAVIKFLQPGAASDAVKALNGLVWNERRLEACFWDGVTDFTVKDEVKEGKDLERREAEFGNWLESRDLPEELRLRHD